MASTLRVDTTCISSPSPIRAASHPALKTALVALEQLKSRLSPCTCLRHWPCPRADHSLEIDKAVARLLAAAITRD